MRAAGLSVPDSVVVRSPEGLPTGWAPAVVRPAKESSERSYVAVVMPMRI